MYQLLKNQIVRNLISTVVFGALYVLLMFLFDGAVDVKNLIISVVTYFVVLGLMCLIAPKLRKILGYDKEDE